MKKLPDKVIDGIVLIILFIIILYLYYIFDKF